MAMFGCYDCGEEPGYCHPCIFSASIDELMMDGLVVGVVRHYTVVASVVVVVVEWSCGW